MWNIESFNILASHIESSMGSFGTGYPFYALDTNLEGNLPIIAEQIRYSRKLISDGKYSNKSIWECKACLEQNYTSMPDLKQVCRPCPKTLNSLKPRKIINRLPDMDMWIVCKDGTLEETQIQTEKLLKEYGFTTSDLDPLKTIDDVSEITKKLKNNELPEKYLPIDCHIIEYSKLKQLIEQVPTELKHAKKHGRIPYLPIHPKSYRKEWQYDDEAYNFIYDYLSAFTTFNFTEELNQTLKVSRQRVISENTSDELFDVLLGTATLGNYRRFSTPELKNIFYKKMNEWKKLTKTKEGLEK